MAWLLFTIFLPAQSLSSVGTPSIKFIITFDRFYGDAFDAPTGIYVDSNNHELYLADSGRDEVLIFDTMGTPIFRVGKTSGISNPSDLVVRSNRIYLSQEGKDYIAVLSYKGDIVAKVRPNGEGPFSPGKMTLDSKGNIYVINKAHTDCMVFDKDDKLIGTIGEGLLSLNAVAVAGAGERIYLITPYDRRAVQVFDKSGKYLMGFEGLEGRGGTLGMPISAKVDRLGFLWLLDAIAGIIVYNEKGAAVARFHPMGPSKGQLVFPVAIDIDDDDRLYVVEKGAKRVTVFKIER